MAADREGQLEMEDVEKQPSGEDQGPGGYP